MESQCLETAFSIFFKMMYEKTENLPDKLTKEWLEKKIDGEWTKFLRHVSEISEEQILRFLVNRRSGNHHRNVEQAKNVKSMEAYKLFMDGHGQKMYVCKAAADVTLTVVKASVLASTR